MNASSSAAELLSHYSTAKRRVIDDGFLPELSWVDGLDQDEFSESDLLREAAWVILCSGFRESVVRAKFSYLSLCFCDWESAQLISDHRESCLMLAEKAFRYRRKLEAIVKIAECISERGFFRVRDEIRGEPLSALIQFPFIGPITSYHLAKNLGFRFAKDDRHLQRLVKLFGFADAQELCAVIARETGDSVPIVDTVLWRNAATWAAASQRAVETT